jgi:hypothetical protein
MFKKILLARKDDLPAEAYIREIKNDCATCGHLHLDNPTTCEAFPHGIPIGIIAGVIKHQRPYNYKQASDNGLQWVPRDGMPEIRQLIADAVAKGFAAILKFNFNPHEPRDGHGKWTSAGAAGARSKVTYTLTTKLREGYRSDVTEEQVMAQFSDQDRKALADAKDRLNSEILAGHETSKLYANKDAHGKRHYTKERQAFHRQIVREIINEKLAAAASDNPTVIFLGGRGGSGKSQFEAHDKNAVEGKGVYDKSKFIVVDPDEIKKELGKKGAVKYEGWNAFLLHDESSDVADMLIRSARYHRLNMVLDMTLKSDKSAQLQSLKKSGYRAEGHYMFLPEEMAAARAFVRFKTKEGDYSGRLVPPSVVLGNKNNEKNFDKLIPLFDNWSVWRNDVPEGSPPKRVSSKK